MKLRHLRNLQKGLCSARKIVFLLTTSLFISSIVRAQNCTVNAGSDKTICSASSQILEGNIGGNLVANTLSWTQISGPNTATITNSTSLSPTVSNLVAGTYVFQIQATCQVGGNATDQVTVTVLTGATAVTPSDIVLTCYTPGTPISLSGTAPAGHTLTWFFSSATAPVSGTFNGSSNNSFTGNNPTIQFSAPPPGFCEGSSRTRAFITVRSTHNGTGCYIEKTVIIYFYFNLGAATAFTDSPSSCTTVSSIRLTGSCANDGSGAWTVVSSPSGSPTVSFSPNTSTSRVVVGNLVPGNYVFRWTVTGSSCGNGSADVPFFNGSGGSGGTIPIVKHMQFCKGQLPSTISLNGNLPQNGETVSWTQVSGPTVTISNANSPIAQASGLTEAGAPYIFAYTITGSGSCPKSAKLRVTVSQPLTYQPVYSGTCNSEFFSRSSLDARLGNVPYLFADSVPVSIIYESGPANNIQLTFKAEMRDAFGGYPGASYYSPAINVSPGQTASHTYFSNTLWPDDNQYSADMSMSFTTWNNISGCSNLLPGVYRFRLMYKGTCGSFVSEPFEITLSASYNFSAGSDQRVTCGTTSTTLAGNIPVCGVKAIWTTVKKPAGATDPINASNRNSPNATLSSLSNGSYVFVWQTDQAGWSGCAAYSDSVRVTVSNLAPATPAVTSGGTYCNSSSINITGDLNDDATDGTWTVSTSPAGGTYNISGTTTPNIVFTPTTANTTYTLTWTVRNGCGNTAGNTTVITNGSTATTPVISNADNCGMSNGTSFGTLSATGGPGVWTSSNSNYTLATPNNSSTTVSPSSYNGTSGAVTFYYTTSGACGTMKDSVTFTNRWADPEMPVINFCQISSFPVTQSLELTKLVPFATYRITAFSGPGNSSITSPMTFIPSSSTYTLTLNAAQEGKYTIGVQQLTGVCSSTSRSFVVQLSGPAPLAIAGSDINMCGSSNTTTLNAEPNPLGSSAGTWNVVTVYNGYAPVFSNAASPTSNVTFNQGAGDALLRWSVTGSNPGCNSSTVDYVRVRYVPAADAGDNKFTCYDASNSPAAILLDGNTPSAANGTWSIVSQPAGANASFVNPNVAGTTIMNLTNGSYNLKWTVTDPSGTCPPTNSTIVASVYYGCTALPVELLSFTARTKNQDVLLNWNMSNDEANTLYIPERSLSPQGPFKSLATINYNSAQKGSYDYTDKNATAAGSNYLYYRLAIRSADNKLSYSKTIPVRLEQEGAIQVYPTITDRGTPITIAFNKNNAGIFHIKTVSINGQPVNEQTITNPRSAKISTDNLPAGSYFIQINNSQQAYVFKVVIK